MYFTKESVKFELTRWCAMFRVPVANVVVFGSAALLFHELVDHCNDIDIEIPQVDIERLESSAIEADIPRTTYLSRTYLGFDVEHINANTDKPFEMIDGLKVCTLDRLFHDYCIFDRPKDQIKLRRIEALMEWKRHNPHALRRRLTYDEVIKMANETLPNARLSCQSE